MELAGRGGSRYMIFPRVAAAAASPQLIAKALDGIREILLAHMDQPFERVYTVHDFYDGPRAGFADFEGRPHLYRSRWDDSADDWTDTFELIQVEPSVLAIALEDWAIWRRWQAAYQSGQVSLDSWPSLPDDRLRSQELKVRLEPVLTRQVENPILAKAEFRRREEGDPEIREPWEMEVRWHPVPG